MFKTDPRYQCDLGPTGAASTVTASVPLEAPKFPDGVYATAIVLLPVAKANPTTTRIALPFEPTAALPSDLPPVENTTLPDGTPVPLAAVTLAVSCADAVCRKLIDEAVAVVTVPVAEACIVTTTVPSDPVNPLPPEYTAVSVLLPAASAVPFRENVATAAGETDPMAVSVAVPRAALPRARITLPVGTVFPETDFTVTVTCVVALCVRLALAAAADVVVATGTGATFTVNTDEGDPLNPVAPL